MNNLSQNKHLRDNIYSFLSFNTIIAQNGVFYPLTKLARVVHLRLPDFNIVIMKKTRPEVVSGMTSKTKTGCGNLYITVNRDDAGNPIEVFINIGKSGGCASSQAEGIGRLISLVLRIGGDVRDVIKQLKGIHCHNQTDDNKSCLDAVAKALESDLESEWRQYRQ